jgi:hypothetical protein
VGWDTPTGKLWPPPDDRDEDLNDLDRPAWIDEAGRRASQRLSMSDLPPVVGHVDWWAPNLLWANSTLQGVVDWDSIAALPEAMVVGVAAAIFTETPPRVEESSSFLSAYQRARGRRFSCEETEISWAAGAWTRTFDAKKESVDGPGPIQSALAEQIEQRLTLAGT